MRYIRIETAVLLGHMTQTQARMTNSELAARAGVSLLNVHKRTTAMYRDKLVDRVLTPAPNQPGKKEIFVMWITDLGRQVLATHTLNRSLRRGRNSPGTARRLVTN
jgi:hypothetical protein